MMLEGVCAVAAPRDAIGTRVYVESATLTPDCCEKLACGTPPA
jgi:hypothetical protein